ncbi:MAG: Histidinol dehydrogenase [Bacteroidota bacterium]|jgi:histidinol dehydrogenase
MLKTILYPNISDFPSLCERPVLNAESLDVLMDDIFSEIKKNGDNALISYTLQFENRSIDRVSYSSEEIDELADKTDGQLKNAIQRAYENIYRFHASQVQEIKKVETSSGVICWQKSSPIEKIGIYIPGGTAPLFSTILMLAIPAKIAGCKEIILSTPAIHPAIFYAAKLCGVTTMIKIGGAQAIAAFSIGTESIPKVYKIFGPGNQYVTAAKMYANRKGTAIDMPAGPSEVAIYADHTSNPEYVAADLLSQAEHGIDSQVILVTTEAKLVSKVEECLSKQLEKLPRRELAIQSLQHSKAIVLRNIADTQMFLNEYGAEHLILACDEAELFSENITNAGSIFLGHYTPESAGDYASGTNHTLPTNGFAKAYSGVNLDSFIKKITLQSISKEGLDDLGDTIIKMAEAESLEAHAEAVRIRLK